MNRWDILAESAQNLEELNVKGAWEKLKALSTLTKDSFKRGYEFGRGNKQSPTPKAKEAPKDDQAAPKKGKKKYQPAAAKGAAKGKKAVDRKAKRARQCTKAKNGKIRCKKPGGGWVYYTPDEFKRLGIGAAK